MSHGHDEPEPGARPGLPGVSSGASAPVDFTSRARCPFAIVDIGGSAGGIDALKAFFSATTADSGMAYVVIQHLFILTALAAMLMAYPAAAAPVTAQSAVWVAYDLSVDLRNLPRRYSCDELRFKVRDMLLVLGARPDLKVLTARCELGSRSPVVRVQFAMPELVDRTSKRGVVVEAAVEIVRLEPGHPASLNATDCELMRQIKDGLLAPMARRVVSFNLACSAASSSGPRFNLSIQILKPLDGGARVADEVQLPLKRPN